MKHKHFSPNLTILAFFLLFALSCSKQNPNNKNITRKLHFPITKHKGTHLFGEINSINIKSVVQNNFNWITLVPFAAQKDIDSPGVRYFRGDSTQRAQRDSAWASQIKIAHDNGFKVFLKPHIWLTEPQDGKWRSDIFPANDSTWQQWKNDYQDYILYYAKLAERTEVELFCIGTEFTRLTAEKPEFWKELIQDIKTVYSGKLTYAANWYEEFEAVTFWGDLDYIGIQAYFPLVKNEFPLVEDLSKGWDKYLPTMEAIHKRYQRPVLFTEMGYKSTADSAIEPWLWMEYTEPPTRTFSEETQANCYQAFFDSVWEKKWFAGVHIWQMRADHMPKEGRMDMDFTPQGKLAEEVIGKGFE